MQISLRGLITQFGNLLQQRLFPAVEQEVGPLSPKHQQLITVLAFIGLEAQLDSPRIGPGRPRHDRVVMARAFVAKAIWNLPTTGLLIEALKSDDRLRRICGWERASQVPDKATFSRGFREFAETELPQRVHAALIERTQRDRLIGHISRDATAIPAREQVVKVKPPADAAATTVEPNGPVPAKDARPHLPAGGTQSQAVSTKAKGAARKPRRKRGEPKPPEQMTRIERQQTMTLEEMLADLPKHCAVGCKTNSHGRKETWRGYKAHIDVGDGQIPISVILTSASLHDSQAAMPLAVMTAQRVTNLYDLADSAYDCEALKQKSRQLGHVPIIERLHRRQGLVPMAPHEAARYRERTSVERVNSRLKDEFGGRHVRVRGATKVMAHVMFGIVALTADQILRLIT